MNYLIKAIIQRVLSSLPLGTQINEKLHERKILQKTPYFTVKQCLDVVSLLQKSGFSLEKKAILELGVGWKPTFALLMKLMGAQSVIMLYQKRYISKKLLLSAIKDIASYESRILQDLRKYNLPENPFKKNLKDLIEQNSENQTLEALLSTSGLEYLAPSYAKSLDLPDSSIDFYFSRQVMEHVKESEISLIYGEANRIIRPSGLLLHLIDIEDHWSYADKSINGLNFLRFNDFEWNIINSPLAYQNRLRASDHIELIEKFGFFVEKFLPKRMDLSLDEIVNFQKKISKKYSRFSVDELTISSFIVLARSLK